jgi:hypothetical protein
MGERVTVTSEHLGRVESIRVLFLRHGELFDSTEVANVGRAEDGYKVTVDDGEPARWACIVLSTTADWDGGVGFAIDPPADSGDDPRPGFNPQGRLSPRSRSMTEPAGQRESSPRPSIDPLRLLTAVGSPIALATALALYFGWVRSRAQADRFGADVSVFDMSPQDLVLRSIDVLFFPILGALLLGLGLVRADPWLRGHAASAGRILWYSWSSCRSRWDFSRSTWRSATTCSRRSPWSPSAARPTAASCAGTRRATRARPGWPTSRLLVPSSSPHSSGRRSGLPGSAGRHSQTTSGTTRRSSPT